MADVESLLIRMLMRRFPGATPAAVAEAALEFERILTGERLKAVAEYVRETAEETHKEEPCP